MYRLNQSFIERWEAFIEAFLDPMVFALGLLSILILVLSLSQPDLLTQTLMILLLSIVTGIAGGIVAKRWDDHTGQRLLVVRGKVAVRSLKLLLSHVNRLHSNVGIYIAEIQAKLNESEGENDDTALHYLKEVSDRCIAIMEEDLSSIDNWADIVPEADVETQFDLLSRLFREGERLQADLDDVTEALGESENASKEEINKLQNQKTKLETELSSVKGKVTLKEFSIRPTINSAGAILSSGTAAAYPINSRATVAGQWLGDVTSTCISCGESFDHRLGGIARCPKCGTAQIEYRQARAQP